MNSEDSLIICLFLKNIESCSLLGQMSSIIIDSWPDLQYHVCIYFCGIVLNILQNQLIIPITLVPLLYSWTYLAKYIMNDIHWCMVHSWVILLMNFSLMVSIASFVIWKLDSWKQASWLVSTWFLYVLWPKYLVYSAIGISH